MTPVQDPNVNDDEIIGFKLTNPAPRGRYGTYYWVCCQNLWAIRNGYNCPSCGESYEKAIEAAAGGGPRPVNLREQIEALPRFATSELDWLLEANPNGNLVRLSDVLQLLDTQVVSGWSDPPAPPEKER